MVCLRARHVLPLLVFPLLSGYARPGLAAHLETLPSQEIPEAHPTAPAIIRQPAETPTPGVPLQLPAPQHNTREIPLPDVFKGCWSGSVPTVDSMQPLGPDMGRLIWLTKTYTICYKQVGYQGKWQLTFAESAVADRREVTDQRQAIKLKSVSSPDRAELSAYLHFRTNGFVGFGGIARPSTLDELTHLDCDVRPALNLMSVKGSVFVETNGEPYAEVTWHTNFFRTGGPMTGTD
jgi:hypothetical protein